MSVAKKKTTKPAHKAAKTSAAKKPSTKKPDVKRPRSKSPADKKKPVLAVDSLGREYRNGTVGQPPKFADAEQLSLLVKIGCTMEEIEQVLKIDRNTLMKNQRDVIEGARKERNIVIRRKQYQLAMEGDRTMLVWLGKQWLGQTDQMQLGVDASGAVAQAGKLIEVVFVESDGDGHLKSANMEATPNVIDAKVIDAKPALPASTEKGSDA